MEYNREGKGAYLRYGLLMLAVMLIIYFIYWLFVSGTKFLIALIPFFLAIVIAYILNPLVEFLERRRMSRSLGILLIYAVFISFLFFIGSTTIPKLIFEMQKLGEMIPEYTASFQAFISHLQSDYQRFNLPESVRAVLDQNIIDLQDNLQNILERLTGTVLNLFSHLFTILITPLLVYYILRDIDNLKSSLVMIFPKRYRIWVVTVGREMDHTLGAYFRGMLFICFVVGLLTYLGLLLLGMEFALILGIISGITNIIPYFGPIIGAVPAVLIALLTSPNLVLKVIVVLVVVQQLESQIVAPQVLGRSLGLHPLIVIFVLILGGRLFGLAGLIFAVPFAAVMRIFLKHALALAAGR